MPHAASGRSLRNEDECRKRGRRHIAEVLSGLPERDQLPYLAKQDRDTLWTGMSLAISATGSPAIAAISAGWAINGKAIAQDVLAERVVRARESRDPTLKQCSEQLAQIRARQAQLAFAPRRREEQQAIADERVKLAKQEEEVSRKLARAGSQSLVASHWVDLDQLRKKLAPARC